MNQEVPKHEKIRFRRGEIASLETLPSAAGQDLWSVRPRLLSRLPRILATVATVATSLALIAAAAIYFIGVNGISTDSIRGDAEAAVEVLAGVDVVASLGPARISLDSSRLVAVEVRDVRFEAADSGSAIIEAGSVRFGVRLLPLLTGTVQLGAARISDARIMAGSLDQRSDADWTQPFFDADGLVDPDLVAEAIFAAVHRGFDALQAGSTQMIELQNVEIVLPEGGALRSIQIAQAMLTQSAEGEIRFATATEVDGRAVSLDVSARRAAASRRIDAIELSLSAAAPSELPKAAADAGHVAATLGSIDVKIEGEQGARDEPSRLSAAVSVGDSVVGLGRGDFIAGTLNLAASVVTGTDKVEIERARISTGRSRIEFHGAMGPKPRSGNAQEPPSYRYEFVSDGSTVAASDSQETAVDLFARVGGRFEPAARKLLIEDFGLRTNDGELLGVATFDFVPGMSPGISVAITVPDMAVSHVKQLWPWLTAAGARRWVNANLFGGRVTDSALQYHVLPGRIGNGVPISGDEVFGTFKIAGARFDMTGTIPPVRDAVGAVSFAGNNVDVSLSSGTVFLSGDRSVTASNGKMTIRDAHLPKVFGALDIDIAGSAPSVAELASYEPINAMRFVGITADQLDGDIKGHIKAGVPLIGGLDVNELGWLVDLDYDRLSIDKPFDGQLVTEAAGSIVVDPKKAVIDAKAKLNGAPAEIDMVEPLHADGPKRERKISVELDDKARRKLVPGLASMLTGPVKVAFDSSGGGRQQIEADLSDAKLDIGWVGWSKGVGIPAKASFVLETANGDAKLTDFKLSGKSFAVAGRINLTDGDLSSATFDTLKLNREDDVRMTIKRSGKGYAIDVKGDALDVRSLVKQLTSEDGGKSREGDAVPVSVRASVGTLTGFHDERLSNVTLSYSGTGSRVDALKVSAVTRAGGAVAVTNGSGDGRRTMEMQSADAGSILRFLDIYEHMEGGRINLALSGTTKGAMRGQVDATDFWVVNEPKLASMVSKAPPGDQRSLNQAVRSDIDTSRVKFERGFAALEKGDGYLALERGVLRGPLIGTTFQGTLYDKQGNMAMTGTFMPAYGLNRLFGELPLVGVILGNGRDRGLIGVTYRLSGKAAKPTLQINPLSVIAPGIFRSIFEFR